MSALDLEETHDYIISRLESAGCEDDKLFDREAVEVIYYFSAGLPRLINTLCDYALVAAYGSDSKNVTFDIALDAVKHKRIGGISRHSAAPCGADKIRKNILKREGVDVSNFGARWSRG